MEGNSGHVIQILIKFKSFFFSVYKVLYAVPYWVITIQTNTHNNASPTYCCSPNHILMLHAFTVSLHSILLLFLFLPIVSMQLNHSLRPPPQVTVRRGAFLRVLRLPAVMIIAKMQRQPTWQRRPSSTCLLAAGRDLRPLAPSPGNRAPRYSFIRAQYSWDVDRLGSRRPIMLSRSLLLKLRYLYI